LCKGGKERYIPFGHKVAKALLKYELKHHPTPIGTYRFWLIVTGAPLETNRIEKLDQESGKKAGLKRCYPHKLITPIVMLVRST
jgi:site-specific recombinase XerD